MQAIELASKLQLVEVKQADDDWTGITLKEERRCRAERLGHGQQLSSEANVLWRPRQDESALIGPLPALRCGKGDSHTSVRSWMERVLLNPYDMLSAFSPAQIARLMTGSLIPNERLAALSGTALALWYSNATERLNKHLFPLSSDHLLTLIHYNNYRGLMMNLVLLDRTSIDFCDSDSLFTDEAGKKIPPALRPTKLQENVVHPLWVDMFPVPRMRDNIIRRLGSFDEDELCSDVTGEVRDVIDNEALQDSDCTANSSQIGPAAWSCERWECPTTAGFRGFILWADPWDWDAWEVTPGFLKKWGWMMAGCPEVMRASNKWREMRGEESIVMEVE